jgi:hypothetical protein
LKALLPSILSIDKPALLQFIAIQNWPNGHAYPDSANNSKAISKQSSQSSGIGGNLPSRKKNSAGEGLKKGLTSANEGYRRSIDSNYQNLMGRDYIGSQLNMINNHIRLQSFVKLKDSQTMNRDMYYLGPLLQAYGTSWNTKMIPPETGVYLDHFSRGALGLLHVIPKLNSFSFSNESAAQGPASMPARTTQRLTILFDLDETLAHCRVADKQGEERESEVEVIIRPFTYQVLKDLRQLFEIGLFTSSSKSYADTIISRFDPSGEIFDFRLYKDSCTDIGDCVFVKNLSIISNRPPESVFIVDNNFYCYALQLTQGIPIIPFTGDSADTELVKLSKYLKFLANCSQPASVNTRYFGHDILLQQINDSLTNLPNLMLERILEVALDMNSEAVQAHN